MGGRVQELECGQGGGMRQGGWVDNGTVLCAYWPNDDDGDDDDSAVNNEEVVTEKPQTTGQVEVQRFSLDDRTVEVIKWFVISLKN